MLLPEFCYGPAAEARRHTQRLITLLKKGASIDDVVEPQTMLNADVVPGLIVLDGPSPLLEGEPHFNLYLLAQEANEKLEAASLDSLLMSCLGSAWGTLAIQGLHCQSWLSDAPYRSRQESAALRTMYMRACLRNARIVEAEGDRYSAGSREGTSVWAASRCLWHALANLGAPRDVLQQLRLQPPEEGLKGILSRLGMYSRLMDSRRE